MNIGDFRDYCLQKKGTIEDFPFDKSTIVFKVGGKMFALADIDNFDSINLKCDPENAVELREKYSGIKPGYHMNKTHWNTIELNTDVNDKLILKLTDDSYQLVVNGLSKKIKETLIK